MADISYNKLCESQFDNILFKKDKLQDMTVNQLKLEVHDTYKKDENIIMNLKPVIDESVISKTFSEEKISKINCHLPLLKKFTTNLNYNTTNNM